jgi:SAM-dependent methyltransferase
MIRNLLLLELPQVCTCPPGVTDIARFQAIPHEIPLANNTLDAMVLHHALETARDPRTAIRECSRVLAEGGRLLICGFNPSSAWGLRRAYSRMFDDSFSDLRFVNPRRLVDWLTVLGFETEAVKYIAYGLPFNTKRADAKLWRGVRATLGRHQLPLGGAYVLSAVKQALAVRPDWRSEAVHGGKLAPVAYPKLSAWNPD